jgi:lipopolysaccharide/colanic/teichoic acid biosynthesis glycosyltransferase
MAKIDIDYARRRSLWRDLRIIVATPFACCATAGS